MTYHKQMNNIRDAHKLIKQEIRVKCLFMKKPS